MFTRTKLALTACFGIGIAIAGLSVGLRSETRHSKAAQLVVPGYAPQKAVYHVVDTDGLTRRGYLSHVLESARNHLNAVGKGQLDLRFVLQGDGLDLLIAAKSDDEMAQRVQALKADGVKFLICRNSLIGRKLDIADLYDVHPEDVVGAAVAEVASLQGQGFAYIRP